MSTDPGRSKPIAFVPPRYGPDVVGGAEAVLTEIARLLADRGRSIEILTTTAVDHYTWANHYPAGTSDDNGILVRRFPTIVDNKETRDRLGRQLIEGSKLSITDQQTWINSGLRVPELYHHVLHHSDDYQALIFAPYMFWTTFAVAQIAPERTILMPCLHDEPAAHLEIFQPVFSDAAACWFLSEPEMELANQVFTLPPSLLIGAGIDRPEANPAETAPVELAEVGPYIFFAGRREWGKGWHELLEAFTTVVREAGIDLSLVTCGVGAVEPDPAVADRVIDLGFVSDATRDQVMAGAAAYVQPSAMESFSRTALEAMQVSTPLIANGEGAVMAWHIKRSGAGVTYDGSAGLQAALLHLVQHPEAFVELGQTGPAYVDANYRWDHLIDRIEKHLDEVTGLSADQPLPGTES